MFKINYGIHKMHFNMFSHQVGWFDSKGIDSHVWGLRIKAHKSPSCGQ
jgi:hypothetical protein